MKQSEVDAIIDTFVRRVNSGTRPMKVWDEVAPSVADPLPAEPDCWDWSIRPFKATWIDGVEERLPRKFPALFRSLITRYIFPEFVWDRVLLFGNTPECIGNKPHELRVALFNDAHLSRVLLNNGYLQFGQPAAGNYDPICFAPHGDGLDPIVRLDHESILIRGQIRVTEQIAASLREFLGGDTL